MPDVELRIVDGLPDGVMGVTDGETIWLRRGLSQRERRCTIAHELEHIDRGLVTRCDSRLERELHAAVARQLIPIENLLDVVAWTDSFQEAAEELWVDVDTLMARLDGLTGEERQMIVDLHDRKVGGV